MDSFNNNAVAMAASIGYVSVEDAAIDDLVVERTSLDGPSRDCQSVQAHASSVNIYSPTNVAEFVETLKETGNRHQNFR